MEVKTSFSIKDLENLSGIKAHTIRIWEKRYKLLEPQRSDTNIRTYDIKNLQKLLNVALLNHYGFKISKVAEMDEDEVNMRVREMGVSKNDSSKAVNTFKMAMLNFDEQLFNNTFNQLQAQFSFREIFLNTFLRLLEDIGVLWTTNTINPAHEHFITTLIKQKLLLNIERVQNTGNNNDKTFVLFLPLNEIHDLGLLYIHFELLIKGYKSIFLGTSVPIDSLYELQKNFEHICFVSYLTVQPDKDDVKDYLETITSELLNPRGEELHILGRNTLHLQKNDLPKQVHVHSNIINLINTL